MLEAMAAGLPIIASQLPAHCEIVQHGKTGMLVDSPQALQDALSRLSVGEANQSMGRAARSWIFEHIGTWNDCAARYVSAYRTLMEQPT
jgi:glycosyltransferase involved in cell wall biosynthesis